MEVACFRSNCEILRNMSYAEDERLTRLSGKRAFYYSEREFFDGSEERRAKSVIVIGSNANTLGRSLPKTLKEHRVEGP